MTDDQIVDAYKNMIYRIAMNYTRSAFDADDVFSETFLRYFRKPRSFESEEHRKAYIIRLTVNCAKDFLKSNAGHEDIDDNDIPDTDRYDEVTDASDIKAAVGKLNPDDANLVYLYYYEEMCIKAIAESVGITKDAVKMRLMRARNKLKTILSPIQ